MHSHFALNESEKRGDEGRELPEGYRESVTASSGSRMRFEREDWDLAANQEKRSWFDLSNVIRSPSHASDKIPEQFQTDGRDRSEPLRVGRVVHAMSFRETALRVECV